MSINYLSLLGPQDRVEARKMGETIFELGQTGQVMYIIKSGTVEIRIGDRVFDRAGPGDTIGEMAILDNAERSASAIAITDCEVIAIDQKRLIEIVHDHPMVAIEMTKAMVRRLRSMNYQVQFDLLTHLPNRTLFFEQCQRVLQRTGQHGKLVGILCLDLDHFEKINDSLGYVAADRLLIRIGARLRGSLHKTNFLARLGADQFAVLIENAGSETGLAVFAQRLMDALAAPFEAAGQTLYISSSIGIAWHRGGDGDVEVLLKNADTAMHLAKQRGRNQYAFFSDDLNAQAREFLTLSNALKVAIERGELSVHYQPRVDVQNGRIIGLEALLRWHHPTMGQISPARFVPIAEQTGLVELIGEWVLREGCRQRKEWLDSGLTGFCVAINLSPRQIAQSGLVDTVRGILSDTGLPPSCLELEITEGTLINDLDLVIEKLHALRTLGVSIALDDFGTGYSSLSYLKRLPLDCMKIDQSFVRGVPEHEQDVAITRTIITLARNLKLKVVMEGVETQDQYAFAQAEGCDEYQGYLFSKALPAAEIGVLLRENCARSMPQT